MNEILNAERLAARFGKGRRWAAKRLRQMRHVEKGGDIWTTEEWLAEWLAAESVPQTNWPKQHLDPLEEAVCSRVIQIVGELTKKGHLCVVKP